MKNHSPAPGGRPRVLVVDDDDSITSSVSLLLKPHGYQCLPAHNPEQAMAWVRQENVSVVLQDMNFSRATSGDEGLALLADLRRVTHAPVILMTAWASIDLAVRGMRAGAADFLTQPWTPDRLLTSVAVALDVRRAQQRETGSPTDRGQLDQSYDFTGIIGRDPELVRILDLAGRVAATDASVLITGESGTGKEGLAEALHRNSRRSGGPFVKVNLGGMAASLFESEMFGHVKGAFTDAKTDRQGRFQVADGGTILLDELGELDARSQVKLLRVLQDRTYEVLGSSQSRSVDVRVISATHRNLSEMVESGSFREDLLYRLNLITLELPPLRRRLGDVPSLAESFLERCRRLYGRTDLELAPDAIQWLQEQSWPGNVRELKQSVERAVLLGSGDRLTGADFGALGGTSPSRIHGLPVPGTMTLQDMERAMIEQCMGHYDGNISKVARALGLSRASLYRRFEKFGFDPGSGPAES